jgi:hypothetical protein
MSARFSVLKMRVNTLILTMAAALVACTASTSQTLRVDWIVPGEHQIVVRSKNFSDTTPMRVKFTDVWQTEEYALFKTESMQLEIIYAEASRAFTVALDYQMPLMSMVETWNLISRQNIVWGPLGRTDTRLGTWFYRTFELSHIQKSCAGFMIEWDEIYEDPQGRPRKVLFGYLCAAEGMALDNDQIRTLISKIGIRPQDGQFDDHNARSDINAGAHSPAAIDAVRGKNRATDTGNPRFPFRFARYYSKGGNGKFN